MDDSDPRIWPAPPATDQEALDGLMDQILTDPTRVVSAIRAGATKLGEAGIRTIESLLRGLRTPEDHEILQRSIRTMIVELDSKSDLESILTASELETILDRSRRIRYDMLAKRFDETPPTLEILDSTDPLIRKAAIKPLIRRYGEQITPTLLGIWSRCTPEEKLEILKCVDVALSNGNLLLPRTAIFDAVADPDKDVRRYAKTLIPVIVSRTKDSELRGLEGEFWTIVRAWPKKGIEGKDLETALLAAVEVSGLITGHHLGIRETFQEVVNELLEARKKGADAQTVKGLETELRFVMEEISSPTLRKLMGIILEEVPKDPPTRFRISKTTRDAQAADPANFRRVFLLPPRQKK